MYGQSFSLSSGKNNGLNAPSYGGGEAGEATRSRGFLSYYEVCVPYDQHFFQCALFQISVAFFNVSVTLSFIHIYIYRSAIKCWTRIGSWSKTHWAGWVRTLTKVTNGYLSTTKKWLDSNQNSSYAMISVAQWYGHWI